jgi:hypothetical protein
MGEDEDMAIPDAMHPITRCSNRVRAAVETALKELPPEEYGDLFAEIEELMNDIRIGGVGKGVRHDRRQDR